VSTVKHAAAGRWDTVPAPYNVLDIVVAASFCDTAAFGYVWTRHWILPVPRNLRNRIADMKWWRCHVPVHGAGYAAVLKHVSGGTP